MQLLSGQKDLPHMQERCGQEKKRPAVHPDLRGIIGQLRHGKQAESKQPRAQPAVPFADQDGRIGQKSQIGKHGNHLCRGNLIHCRQNQPDTFQNRLHDQIIQRRMHVLRSEFQKLPHGLTDKAHGKQLIIPDILRAAQAEAECGHSGRQDKQQDPRRIFLFFHILVLS